jgi:phage-related baseplate assembly protein
MQQNHYLIDFSTLPFRIIVTVKPFQDETIEIKETLVDYMINNALTDG